MLEMLILMLCFMGQAIRIFITEERHAGIPLHPGNMGGAGVKERMERKK